MANFRLKVFLFFLALLSFFELPVTAQEAESPILRVSAPAFVFRQGELIPLILSFTSKVHDRYQVNMATYDRSGRMGYEKFFVEPTDQAADPLTVYFKSGLIFMTGGITNFEYLSDSPYVLHLDLNEWIRFEAPGHYHITVSSRRVSDVSGGNSFYQGSIQELKSNSIDLEIIPADSAWQEAQLKKILIDLDQPSKPALFLNQSRAAALRALRYLGSPDAARELARHMRGEEDQVDWNCLFGLIGSPNRLVGYEEMKKLLIAPDFPIGGIFLNAFATVPLDPAESAEHLRQQREANWKDARSSLTAAISIKRGKALAVSLDTVLQNPDSNISKEATNKLVFLLIDHFNDLAIEKQRRWLEEKWPTVKDAAWLPTLRAIAAEYADYPVPYAPNVLPTYNYFKLSGDGLIRWYELDPEGARPAVLAEITRQRPRFSANTLGILPDKVLLNEQRAIADHFLEQDEYAVEGNLASLLNRYADAAVLAEVLPKITRKMGGLWACFPENNAVAYVQRVDPEAAKPLVKLVSSGCRNFPSLSDLP